MKGVIVGELVEDIEGIGASCKELLVGPSYDSDKPEGTSRAPGIFLFLFFYSTNDFRSGLCVHLSE